MQKIQIKLKTNSFKIITFTHQINKINKNERYKTIH